MLIENPRILCVDATHGVTGYDYYLLSIAVIDINGSALLCAWALASRENREPPDLGDFCTEFIARNEGYTR